MAVLCVNQPVACNKPALPGAEVNLPIAIYCTSFDGPPGGGIASNVWINPESGGAWTNPESSQSWTNPEK